MSVSGDKIVNLTDLKVSHDAINERIDQLLAENMLFDGTPEKYKAVMKWYFDTNGAASMTAAQLTALVAKWYDHTRTQWNGWVEFKQPAVSNSSDGTKGGDNAGLVCVPSTNEDANRDDYAGNPLFACVDCNFTVDADTLEPVITAIDGIAGTFKRNDPTVYVGVLQMAGWHWYDEEENVYIHGYSAIEQSGHDYCQPLPEAVKASDNSMRSFVVHSKYMSRTESTKLTSYAGKIPTAWMSHNASHTASGYTGAQYSGACVIDYAFLQLMAFIKYGKMTLDGTLHGCLDYNYQYFAQAAEEGVKRVLLKPTEAANLKVGSGVLIGAYNGETKDRGTAANYSVTGQAGAIITAIESVTVDGNAYAAVTVDTSSTFDTVANGDNVSGTTILSTFHWPNGSCDSVKGNDGSPASPGSGKYPAKLQGIEFAVGGYEVMADVILNLYQDGDDYYYKPYLVAATADQSTSITEDYTQSSMRSLQPTGSAAWQYIRKLSFADGIFFGTDTAGGSSSTFTRDAFYKNAETVATREWLAFGSLPSGTGAGGLSNLTGNSPLGGAAWSFLARLSPNGNRGEWAAA